MTISKDRVKPSPHPDSWKLPEIFITGIVYGAYLAVTTVVFFFAMTSTDFFSVSVVTIHAMANPSVLQDKMLNPVCFLYNCRRSSTCVR